MPVPRPPRPTPKIGKRLAWRIEYAAYRGIECLLMPFPVAVACHLGGLLGALAWYLLPSRRALVIRNLRIAFGREASLGDLEQLARRVFARCGANMIAAVKTATLPPDKVRACVTLEGQQGLQQILASKRGAIFLLPHQGNWELLAQLGLALAPNLPAAAMYRPLSNPLLDALVRRRRQRLGTRLISNREGPLAAISHLRGGGVIGILADQQAGYHGLPAVYFTRLASLTPLPMILGRRTGAPIVPLAMRQDRPGKWTIRLFPELVVADPGDPSPMAQAYERIIRWATEDYFWLQDPWKTLAKFPLRFARAAGKRATPPLPESFPVLVHLPVHLAELTAALVAARPDAAVTVLAETGASVAPGTRVLRYDRSWDATRLAAELRRYEESLAAPFEAALLLAGSTVVAAAARRARLRRLIGTDDLQQPFCQSLPATATAAEILALLRLADCGRRPAQS
jgi:lauroyl/myristoyl acyltransferase